MKDKPTRDHRGREPPPRMIRILTLRSRWRLRSNILASKDVCISSEISQIPSNILCGTHNIGIDVAESMTGVGRGELRSYV